MASLPLPDHRIQRGPLPLRKPGSLNSWLSFLTVSKVSLSISDGSTSTRRRTLVGLSRSTVVFIERHRSAQLASLDAGRTLVRVPRGGDGGGIIGWSPGGPGVFGT